MRVLSICSYPIESAATRYRLHQFVEPLRKKGIDMRVVPFLDSKQFRSLYVSGSMFSKGNALLKPFFSRISLLLSARKFDVLFVQREAMFLGPEIFEVLYRRVGRLPMVLDLDDATYVSYESPTYGRLGSILKFFGKTDRLIRHAENVTCGNRFIAEYVEEQGTKSTVLPTVVDTDLFKPATHDNEIPVIGWIGTHSTFPFVESIFPVLQRLAKDHQFRLRLVGTGRESVEIPGVDVENVTWSLEREADDFGSMDIGLYPIFTSASANQEWLKGKSGFKAIQYMSVGVPFVMSPVGVCAELGNEMETHFNAESMEDWYTALGKLLSDSELRGVMGKAGRSHALANYTVEKWSAILADVLFSTARKSTGQIG